MPHRWWFPVLLLVASTLSAHARTLGQLDFTPCTLSNPQLPQFVEAQCTMLQVPENPDAPDGRAIHLRIGWLPAKQETNNQPDPVFMLAGGPGQSALDSYPSVRSAFAEINQNRSIILVDQRGTGQSNVLQCTDQKQNAYSSQPQDISAFTQNCLAQLEKKADLRFYTTGNAIVDLDAVRKAIGADQINLVGISYGTRVAQQYAATYPQHTRSIVLDSVAPNSLVLGNEFSQNLERALALQFGQCSKEPNCTQKLGQPRQQLNALMHKLKTAPPTATFRDPSTGETRKETLQPDEVARLVQMYAYLPPLASILPLHISEAMQGRYDMLAASVSTLNSSAADNIAVGMSLSVICSEDASELKIDPTQEASLLGNSIVENLKVQCAIWPKGTRVAKFRQPLSTNVPALLLSGEFDPVTPPSYGEEVAKTLPNARHLVLRGQGHNVITAGCMPQLLSKFIDTKDAKALDATCLNRLIAPAPFTGFYGWEP